MKKLLAILLFFSLTATSQQKLINVGGWNCYVHVPYNYNPAEKYPTIIFTPGLGEVGTNAAALISNGPGAYISQGWNGNVKIGNDSVRFIVISLQPPTAWPGYASLDSRIQTLKTLYSIDPKRMHLTGLSMGGWLSMMYATGDPLGGPYYYSNQVASVVSVEGVVSSDNSPWPDRFDNFSLSGGKMLNFEQKNDYRKGDIAVARMNATVPGSATYISTNFSGGGHCCWNQFYGGQGTQPGVWTLGGISQNVYQWMARQSKVPSVAAPTVNAGADQSITGTTASLSGSATAGNGHTISTYLWTKVSGTGSTITSPSAANTGITGLSIGVYVYNLKVTQNDAQTANDQVQITVSAVPTGSYKIDIDPKRIFYKGDTTFFQVISTLETGLAQRMFDEQAGNDPKNGITNATIPSTAYFPNYSAQTLYPEVGILDLGGNYTITDIWIYNYYTGDTLYVQSGQPYAWSNTPLKIKTGGNGWMQVPMSGDINTRFLRYSYPNDAASQRIYEMVLYGYANGDTLSRTAPINYSTLRAKPLMGKFIGTNAFDDPYDVREVGGNLRRYVNSEWFDTSLTEHNVNNIKFSWIYFKDTAVGQSTIRYTFPGRYGEEPRKTLNWTNNIQADLRHFNNLGIDQFFSMQSSPKMFLDKPGYFKPIDPVLFPDRDSTNPLEYTRTGRMFWQIAAAYGNQTHDRDSMQITTISKDSTGLGVMKYLELGNEMDGGWNGQDHYYSPEAYIAFSSAAYDGNNGQMGNRFGIKRADPTMQVVEAGRWRFNWDRLKAMKLFSYYLRPDKTYPMDVMNFHDYFWNSNSTEGVSPESYDLRSVMGNIVDSSHIVCPTCEVWLTEFGYDRNSGSTINVPKIAGSDSATTQAQWLARSWFMLSFSGLDRATQFMIRNGSSAQDYDVGDGSTYGTSGLVSGKGYDSDSGYTINYFAYPAYYFQKTIYERLKYYKPDAVLRENVGGDSIWVYKYRSTINTDSVAYAVWSGTRTNKVLTGYKMKTGYNAQVVTLADKYMLGQTSNVTTDGSDNIPITISETPRLVFTKDLASGGDVSLVSTLPVIIRNFFVKKGKIIWRND